ncbi:RNA methyltransferase [Sulfurimonas sp. HSL3-7]|uniref:TrmH family RNA methyltransferase n=1 Tax=Sulfonitrofixus jiaomeiensis TaxID=3131938 RepID=UPI0031F76BD5
MNLTEIDNLDTPSLEIYRQLRDNAFSEDNSFIADSPKVVNMLLETAVEVKSILATKTYYEEFGTLVRQKEIPLLYVAEKKVIEKIVGHKVHHNVMMHGIRPAETPLDALDDTIIMLDEITSTENIGSIARSAAALGVGSYLLPKHGPHPYGRRALRVSMGHVSKLKVHCYDDIFATLKTLKANGYRIFAAEVTDDATPLAEIQVPKKWVLLMGHEGRGISPEVLAACDEAVRIEMEPGIRSFNVGVAAAILMYQFKNRG